MDTGSPRASPEPSEALSSPPSSPVEDNQQAKKKRKKRRVPDEVAKRKKPRKEKKDSKKSKSSDPSLTPAQASVDAQMKRALEEDQYSALGSVVDTDDSDDDSWQEDHPDRQAILMAWRRQSWLHDKKKGGRKKKRKKGKRREDPSSADNHNEDGSIFPSTGGSNATWVECDKCKKWRLLRGVVDAKKLPSKWYCSMNRTDPERARCSVPEEEYDSAPPESATEQRMRRHLRLWVRRLQGHEAYEGRPQPSMTTRTKNKRNSLTTRETPYEWIRCCNPSCGKWRALLKCMDAKKVDRCPDGKWYCVMNSWDEKTASCAAPQENLPALGCPPWVLHDAL